MEQTFWASYVRAIAPRGARQQDIADATGQTQATVSRWLNSKTTPDEAAVVAVVAKAFGHNVLEAFVAAGFITEAEAGRGLTSGSRRFLAQVRGESANEEARARQAMRDAIVKRRASQLGDENRNQSKQA